MHSLKRCPSPSGLPRNRHGIGCPRTLPNKNPFQTPPTRTPLSSALSLSRARSCKVPATSKYGPPLNPSRAQRLGHKTCTTDSASPKIVSTRQTILPSRKQCQQFEKRDSPAQPLESGFERFKAALAWNCANMRELNMGKQLKRISCGRWWSLFFALYLSKFSS